MMNKKIGAQRAPKGESLNWGLATQPASNMGIETGQHQVTTQSHGSCSNAHLKGWDKHH